MIDITTEICQIMRLQVGEAQIKFILIFHIFKIFADRQAYI